MSDAAEPLGPPMLATLSERLPSGGGWAFEIKWDGFRALARAGTRTPRLVSRGAKDLGPRFPPVLRALPGAVEGTTAVLDGEVCALDEQGRPSFSAMQQGSGPLRYFVFDILELGGESLVDRPLRERQAVLAEVLHEGEVVRRSEVFTDGEALLAAAREQGLEGVMAKRLSSPYRPGIRNRDWLKVKARQSQEMVIAGYTRGHGRRQGGLGALVLGVRRGTDLVWAGNCGTGFGERERRRLEDLLRPLERPTPPFAAAPRMPRVRRDDVTWVEPELVCEVEFSEWTHDGRLRAPSYQGLRDDKPAEEVRREMPVELELGEGRRRLQLKNLDKVFWPDEGITKGDLVDYYRQIAPTLVPHLAGRPFTMKRFPDGIAGQSFFQKDAPKHMPEWIRTAAFPATSRDGKRVRTINYPLVDDELALLWMAGMGCIDMNAWYSRVDKADRPDFVLFDLDPSEGASFADCVRVAHLVHEALGALGLEALVKTSGSKGIHVIAPIVRRHTYAETRAFAEGVAGALERLHPGLVTTEWSKAKRRGILIDANQNGQGRTIASVYSVRPRPGAPVSTPLRWDELTEDIDPRDFTMAVVLDRVSRHGDLMEPALHAKQGLGKALRALAS